MQNLTTEEKHTLAAVFDSFERDVKHTIVVTEYDIQNGNPDKSKERKLLYWQESLKSGQALRLKLGI